MFSFPVEKCYLLVSFENFSTHEEFGLFRIITSRTFRRNGDDKELFISFIGGKGLPDYRKPKQAFTDYVRTAMNLAASTVQDMSRLRRVLGIEYIAFISLDHGARIDAFDVDLFLQRYKHQ